MQNDNLIQPLPNPGKKPVVVRDFRRNGHPHKPLLQNRKEFQKRVWGAGSRDNRPCVPLKGHGLLHKLPVRFQKFPGEYEPLANHAKEEQDNGVLPVLTSHIGNLDEYDTVFIGYPVWWYTLPQVMLSFFEEYDFSGKTLIPFCTHLGSRSGGTFERIAELEPGTTVRDGFFVSMEDAADAEPDVLQ